MILLNMSHKSLHRKTLDRIYEEVIDHMKISGAFDKIKANLSDSITENPNYESIVAQFEYKCKMFCRNMDLRKDRKVLRINLHEYFDGLTSLEDSIKKRIQEILDEHRDQVKTQYTNCAESFLKKRFLPQSPPPPIPAEEIANIETELQDGDVDMEIDSSGGESPQAPEFSPISNPDINCDDLNDHHEEPNMTIKIEPSLEDIPIPPEDECPGVAQDHTKDETIVNNRDPTPVKDECPTPVKDEHPTLIKTEDSTPVRDEPPTQPPDEESDELEKLTFSSVSSVNTADLSDFDESINLSDDEANIVGRPRNSRIPIKVLQGTISDLQTKNVDCKLESIERPVEIKQEPSETGESDGCSEGTATGRRAARKRKSNPRYSNEHYTY